MQENSYDCCDSDLSESPVQVQDQDSQVEGQGQGELENNLSCRVDLKVHICAVWPPIVLSHLAMVLLNFRMFVVALPFDYLYQAKSL